MEVHRLVPIRVRNLHHVPFATLASSEDYSSAANRLHWRADGSAVIRSHVRTNRFENRMESRVAEMRSNRRTEFERRTQEGLLQRLSVRGVVAGLPRRIMKQQRLIFSATVVIFRGEDFSIRRGLTGRIFFLFEHDAERIAFSR